MRRSNMIEVKGKARAKILRALYIFLSTVIPVARNARLRHGQLLQVLLYSFKTGLSVSKSAEANGWSHSAVVRLIAKTNPKAIADAMVKAIAAAIPKRLLARISLYAVDYTFIPHKGKSMADLARGVGLKLLVAYSPGRLAVLVGLETMSTDKEELYKSMLAKAPRGSVVVADAEFSSKAGLGALLDAADRGLIRGFVVKASRRWWGGAWEAVRQARRGTPVPVEVLGRTVYAWRVVEKKRSRGRVVEKEAMLFSSSPSFGPGLYRRRWKVEALFEAVKGRLPLMKFRKCQSRLLVFAFVLLLCFLCWAYGISVPDFALSLGLEAHSCANRGGAYSPDFLAGFLVGVISSFTSVLVALLAWGL